MRLASARRLALCVWVLAAACGLGSAAAQERDAYGNPVGAPPDDRGDARGEIRQTVARISELDGSVSYARGDDPDDWQSADRNVPVTLGDRLYTGERSRVELQVHGGSYVRLGSGTDLAVLNLTDDTKQFALKSGVASVRIRRLDSDEVYEVDTPNAAITLARPGNYRVDIDEDGNTRVTVHQGSADVSAGGGSISLGDDEAVQVWGTDSPQYDTVAMSAPDGWDRWVEGRESRITNARSAQYVSEDVAGVDDLDEYGRWDNIPNYGSVWTPTAVALGWAPYRDGQWIWQDPWGWTWVAIEPWGWAPYHYGRWVFWSSRWYWVPVARRVRYVTYSPALVAFVGGGPGWSPSVTISTGGYVGWFPLAPRDPFIHWWGARRNVHVTNVTYVNRTYVTVVNQMTFVSGRVVVNNIVRDRTVIRQVETAPILRGPLPFVPTRDAIRIAGRPAAAPVVRPSAAVVARPVVARVAPPPAPPTFDRKVAVIRENRGAPVAPAVAAEIAVRDRSRPQASTTIKPAAAEPGRMTFAPRARAASSELRPAPKVAPVAPVRGRAMATAEQPVAAAPVAAPRSGEPVRARPTPSERDSANGGRGRPAPVPPGRTEPAPSDRRDRPTPGNTPRRNEPAWVETPAMRAAPSREEDRRYVQPAEPAKPRETGKPSDSQGQRSRETDAAAERERAAAREREAAQKRREAQGQRSNAPDQPKAVPPRSQPTPQPAPANPQPAARRPPEPSPKSVSRLPERTATPRGRRPEPTKKPDSDKDDKNH